jgi:two-component system chemotaxis response regulator CheY
MDDSPTVCRLVETLLRKCGFDHIETVQDGFAALALLKFSPFDIIICDWEMQPVGGLEVLDRVRGNPDTKGIFFVLMSARKDPVWVLCAIEASADCLLTKPFDAAILKRKIGQGFTAPREEASVYAR